jgi:hypothetical protein
MKKFKYISANPDGSSQETWVCSKCKMANNELILLKKWALIDMTDDPVPCELCQLKPTEGETITD